MSKSIYFTKDEFDPEKFDGLMALSIWQIEEIKKKTPKSAIEILTDEHGREYKSVKGHYLKKKLNIIFGWNWDFEIISKEYFRVSKEALVHGRLTARSQSHTFKREQFGKFNLNIKVDKQGSKTTFYPDNIGNAYKAAATDCLKKCTSEIGICWDVYGQPWPEPIKEPIAKQGDYDEQKVTERIIHFLDKATNIEGIDQIIKVFEETDELTKDHYTLIEEYKTKLTPNSFESK